MYELVVCEEDHGRPSSRRFGAGRYAVMGPGGRDASRSDPHKCAPSRTTILNDAPPPMYTQNRRVTEYTEQTCSCLSLPPLSRREALPAISIYLQPSYTLWRLSSTHTVQSITRSAHTKSMLNWCHWMTGRRCKGTKCHTRAPTLRRSSLPCTRHLRALDC